MKRETKILLLAVAALFGAVLLLLFAPGQARDAAEVRALRAKAEQGDPADEAALGVMYATSRGRWQNYAEAAKWLQKAALQGNARGEYNLGVCYYYGQGVPVDYALALKWYEKAAAQGNLLAEVSIGSLYQEGHGVPQSNAEAAKWYLKAAKDNLPVAEFNLAVLEADTNMMGGQTEAVKLYRKAAEQGMVAAQDNLAVAYCTGNGIPLDYDECRKWFQRAAAQGDDGARRGLAALDNSPGGFTAGFFKVLGQLVRDDGS